MEQQAFGAFVMNNSKPQGSWVHVEQVGDELVLRWRAKRSTAAAAGSFALFLLLMAILTAICTFLMVNATPQPTRVGTLLSIFVLGFFIPEVCGELQSFLRTERLRIGPDGLDYQSRALIPLQERHVPLGEIKEQSRNKFPIS